MVTIRFSLIKRRVPSAEIVYYIVVKKNRGFASFFCLFFRLFLRKRSTLLTSLVSTVGILWNLLRSDQEFSFDQNCNRLRCG